MVLDDKIRIIFFGTGQFAVPTLSVLKNDPRFEIELVVSEPAKPVGRDRKLTHSPVAQLAQQEKLELFMPSTLKNENTATQILSHKPDVIVNVAYGHIIPKKIFESPPLKTMNVHPSLLPKLRGPAPIQYALLENLKETGVTLMIIDEQIDHGPILSQERLDISQDDDYSSLESKLAFLGAKMIMRDLPRYARGELKPTEQDHQQATYTKKIIREDGRVNWTLSADEIHNRARALIRWPGLHTFAKNRKSPVRLKLIEIEKVDHRHPHPAGTLFLDEKKNVLIACRDGAIKIIKIQPESKKILTADEFLNGYGHIVNQVLD